MALRTALVAATLGVVDGHGGMVSPTPRNSADR